MSATLSRDDARCIETYFGTTEFERSTAGAVIDRVEMYSMSVIRRRAAEGLCDAPGGSLDYDARPNSMQGTRSGGGGSMARDHVLLQHSSASRVFRRLAGIKVGRPPVPVEAVFSAAFWASGTDGLADERHRGGDLACLTGPGQALLLKVRRTADEWAGRVAGKYRLSDRERRFVQGVDLGEGHEARVSRCPLDPDAKRRPITPYRFAAHDAGWAAEEADAKAAELMRDSRIQEAIRERERCEVILGLSGAQDAILWREVVGGQHGKFSGQTGLVGSAEEDGEKLWTNAVREWNGVAP